MQQPIENKFSIGTINNYLYNMKISEITNHLESIAPISSQESYDNCGLLVGDKNSEISNVLITLDCIETTIDEAIEKKCNLIIAHHPIIFKGLKKITGKNYVERTILKAIKNNIAIYATHTNLDNYMNGVNKKIGEKLGIKKTKILQPSLNTLCKIAVYVPKMHQNHVMEAMFNAGAGNIGHYAECSFSSSGHGTFKASANAKPFVGEIEKRHKEDEIKIELIVSTHQTNKVIQAMLAVHPYEEVAYDIYPLLNQNNFEGAGMIGELDSEISEIEFLQNLKRLFGCNVIRHTSLLNKPIKRIAWCGGSGSFLLAKAIVAKADIFITGDFKYHDFFDADNQIIIADIGHFESEQFTIELLNELIQKKFPKFAPCLTGKITNPVNYF